MRLSLPELIKRRCASKLNGVGVDIVSVSPAVEDNQGVWLLFLS